MSKRRLGLRFAVLAVVAALPPASLAAAETGKGGTKERAIAVDVGGSQSISAPFAIDRAIVGNPALIDVSVVSGNQLLVTGKLVGETQVTITSNAGKTWMYRVLCSYPTSMAQTAIEDMLPGYDIQVRSSGRTVFLTGRVADAVVAETAARIVSGAFADSSTPPTMLNLIQVGGTQQVQLRMKFVEISRTALRAMGANAWSQGKFENGQSYSGALVGPGAVSVVQAQPDSGLTPLAAAGATAAMPMLLAPVSGTFNILFSQLSPVPISASLAVLAQHGLAKTLSEPTLVAMSGQRAAFLAGGEFPIPMPDTFGRVTVEFKKFGVQLEFTPTVLADDSVQLVLKAAVSELDTSAGVTVANVTIPGLTSRESSTTIRLKDNQSFAIAGLLSDSMRSSVAKVPLLGDVPVLGMLFRSVRYSRNETELVILVSVDLVHPMAQGDVPPIPGDDEYNDPGDLRLFLMGTIDAEEPKPAPAPVRGGSDKRSRAPGAPVGSVGFAR
ncbi:MAG: type II and III secretion system protein family protein [Deltaproteobacteria bacterium]|nr:type II and III secretion system protein family protein [Deltaproteobacteria bacterium]